MRKPRCLLLLSIAAAAGLPRPAQSCTMSLPVEIENEWEVSVTFEDYTQSNDTAYYQVEIETNVVPPGATTTCQCGLGLGSTGSTLPDSVSVFGASVTFRSDSGRSDLPAFAGFAPDSGVGATVASLTHTSEGFGFSAQVNPFTPPALAVGDSIALTFTIGLHPADYDAVNGTLIRFAAGSTDPGHALAAFSGYQTILSLPPIVLPPLRGDYNGDGAVDAADYTVWRDTLGSTDDLRADGDESGEIDRSDYEEWEQRYGTGTAQFSAAVPEPGSFAILSTAAVLSACRRRSSMPRKRSASGSV